MPSNHSKKHPGLQRHSVGELYPWTVSFIDGGPGGLRASPFNCLTGKWGPEFSVAVHGFASAHRMAEQYATQQRENAMHGISTIKALNENADLIAKREREQRGSNPPRLPNAESIADVIRARHAFSQEPTGDNIAELLKAVDRLAALYGAYLLKIREQAPSLGALLGSLVDTEPAERAQAIEAWARQQ